MKQLKNVKIGDILLLYVKSPVKRVLGFCKVKSRMFEESRMTPWEDRLYPYRLRISHVKEANVPFKRFVGKIGGIKSRIPMGVSLIPLCEGDLETILGSDFLQRSHKSLA